MKKIAAVVGLALLVPLATCRDSVAPDAPSAGARMAAVSASKANLATSWSPIHDMALGRDGPAVTTLNGLVYAFGGQGAMADVTAEKYDALSNSWSFLPTMPTSIVGAVAAGNIPTGQIYIIGGARPTGYSNAVTRFTLATGTYSNAAPMFTPRFLPAVGVLGSGNIMVAGGFNTPNQQMASVEVYNPSVNSWSPSASMPVARYAPGGVVGGDGKFYVWGGIGQSGAILASGAAFDPQLGIWTVVAPMPSPRYGFGATPLLSGKILVFGGYDGSGQVTTSVIAYDPATNSWESAGDMSAPRALFGYARLPDGRAVAVGGESPGQSAMKSGEAGGVSVATSTTTLASSANPTVPGQFVTLTVTVVGAGAPGPFPGEQVTITDGSNTIATLSLGTTGSASFVTNSLGVGTHFLRAFYPGSSTLPASSSALLTQVVNKSASATSVNQADNPSTYSTTHPLTIRVTPAGDGIGVPTGLVDIRLDGSPFTQPLPLTGGQVASPPLEFLGGGSHVFTISYFGDANFEPSSTTFTQVVNAMPTIASVNVASPSTFNKTQPFIVSAMRASPFTFTGPISGDIQIVLDGQVLTQSTLNAIATQLAGPLVDNLAVGTHTVTANFLGNANYAPSSATTTQVVNLGIATTSVASSQNPSLAGQQVTLTASLDAPGFSHQGNPTGTVTFYDCGVAIGTVPVANRTAQISTAFAAGSHTLTATYSGDANYATNTSAPVDQVTTLVQTSTSLTSDGEPSSVYGQNVTLTATVGYTSSGVSGTPTGTVTFTIFGANLTGPIPLVNGVASSPPITFGVGQVSLGAVYSGDANTATSTGLLTHTTNKSPVTVVVASPSTAFGQTTITAHVIGVGVAFPDNGESVSFSDNGSPIGTATTDQGLATLNAATLGAGSHNITASYGGNGWMLAATGTSTVVVSQAASSTTLSAAANPTIIGNPVNYSAHVVSVSGFGGVPTGSVTFSVDGSPYASNVPVQPDGSAAAPPLNGLSLGTHTISATYGGSSNFVGSSSPTTTHTVNPPPDLPPVANAGADQSTVAGASGASVTLNGTASTDPDDGIATYAWSEGGVSIATGATPTVTLAVGTHTITLRTTDVYGLYSDDQVVVTVLSPAGGTSQLGSSVQTLLTSGAITSTTANQFSTSLDAAAASIASGNTNAASNQIGAFINKVQAALNSGKISAANAAALLAFAQQIQNSL